MPNRTVRASAQALPKEIFDRPRPVEADFIDDLSFLPNRYGLVCVGDCLDPLVPNGETILVDKTEPYAPGDLVVVFRKRECTPGGKFQGLVKRLVMAPPSWVKFPCRDHPQSELAALVVVETLNPPAQFAYRCADLLGIHKCLGVMPAEMTRAKAPLPDGCCRSRARRTLEVAR